MKKLIGIVVVSLIVFFAFNLGLKEVFSNIKNLEKIEKNNVAQEEKDNKEEKNNEKEVLAAQLPQEEDEEEEVKAELTYEEVVQMIENDDKNIVQFPDNMLVLVNKENNLPSTYVPQDLVKPNVPFSFKGDDPKMYMRQDAAMALEKLITQASAEGININAVSGYRSYARQKAIFLNNVKKYGFQKANTFSALPGQSEHQTGLAMDVSGASVNNKLVVKFGETPEGIWLRENAHRFGFIIRYPEDKVDITGYQYEPWHIRYVGVEHAEKIKAQNLTLEEYL